jgi:hypothetical protein
VWLEKDPGGGFRATLDARRLLREKEAAEEALLEERRKVALLSYQVPFRRVLFLRVL